MLGRRAKFGFSTSLAAWALASTLSFAAAPAPAPAPAADTPAETGLPATAKDAPNVLVLMIDDLGFAQLGAYGGIIDTPNLDRLAQNGVKFTNYHTTPVCSASRSALLTGRNPHAVHMGSHVASAVEAPGYDGFIPAGAGTLAENLRQAGYATFAVGKWDHLRSEFISSAGPFTYWPTQQGFERYYGFLAAETDNFRPQLWSGNEPAVRPDNPDYHMTTDLADKAISFIDEVETSAEHRPFFLYFAPGAVHAPHHAPESYIQRYKGKFDRGWDVIRSEVLQRQIAAGVVPRGTKLAPRPDGMPAWSSLTTEQKATYARAMEAFAGQLTHLDEQFGRVLDELQRRGELDNTIVVVTSDNGASAEGAPDGTYNAVGFSVGKFPSARENSQYHDVWGQAETFNHYPMGWAVAGNTPFRYYKITTYEGGVRVPLIVSWKKGLGDQTGQIRQQFVDVIDIAPTIMDLAHVAPAQTVNNVPQLPFNGESMESVFEDANAPSPRKVQYFEMFGNRGIWSEGWKAVVPHGTKTWLLGSNNNSFDQDVWELYDLNTDLSESHNLAKANPAQLAKMQALFDQEAAKYNIYPLHNPTEGQAPKIKAAAQDFARRGGLWTYPVPVRRVNATIAPPVMNKAYRMTADVEIPAGSPSGPVWIIGGAYVGSSFYLANGKPTFAYRTLSLDTTTISATQALSPGVHKLEVAFKPSGDKAEVQLFADGVPIASGSIEGGVTGHVPLNEPFSIGEAPGSSVDGGYSNQARYAGTISNVSFDFNQ